MSSKSFITTQAILHLHNPAQIAASLTFSSNSFHLSQVAQLVNNKESAAHHVFTHDDDTSEPTMLRVLAQSFSFQFAKRMSVPCYVDADSFQDEILAPLVEKRPDFCRSLVECEIDFDAGGAQLLPLLARVTSLRALTIIGEIPDEEPTDLLQLQHFQNLEKLEMPNCGGINVSEDGIFFPEFCAAAAAAAEWSIKKTLKHLAFKNATADPIPFVNLFPNLLSLDVESAAISIPFDAQALAIGNPKLKKLHVGLFSFTDTLASLGQLTNMEELSFTDCSNYGSLAFLKDLGHSLKSLRFESFSESADEEKLKEEVKHVSSLPLLEVFSFVHCASFDDVCMKHLGGLTHLRELDLTNTKITAEGFAHLKSLENLEKLTCARRRILDDDDEVEPSSPSIIRDLWSSLPKLKHVDLSYWGLRDGDLEGIAQLKNSLEKLKIQNYQRITAQGLAQLSKLTNLRELSLPRFDDEIARLLFGNDPTTSFPFLTSLNLGASENLTEDGFKHLVASKSLKTNLQSLCSEDFDPSLECIMSSVVKLTRLETFCTNMKVDSEGKRVIINNLKNLKMLDWRLISDDDRVEAAE